MTTKFFSIKQGENCLFQMIIVLLFKEKQLWRKLISWNSLLSSQKEICKVLGYRYLMHERQQKTSLTKSWIVSSKASLYWRNKHGLGPFLDTSVLRISLTLNPEPLLNSHYWRIRPFWRNVLQWPKEQRLLGCWSCSIAIDMSKTSQ